jgi:hypothetical protein
MKLLLEQNPIPKNEKLLILSKQKLEALEKRNSLLKEIELLKRELDKCNFEILISTVKQDVVLDNSISKKFMLEKLEWLKNG